MRTWPLVPAGLAALAAALPETALAGAFQINERSAKSQGMSLADSVSGAKDATYAGFNPAALSRVEDFEAAGNLSFVAPISEGEASDLVFTDPTTPGATPVPVTDAFARSLGFATETNADRSAGVPALALGYRVHPDVVLGFVTKTPFGLATENPDDFVGAPDGIASSLLTLEAAPTISWQATDRLALGASLNVLYADARLTSSSVALDGDDLAVSFSAGALWEPIDGTTFGIAYHNGYQLDVEGDGSFREVVPAPFGGRTVPVTVTADLPRWLQVGVTQEITPRARVSLEGRWIDWSDFSSLDIDFAGPAGALDTIDRQNYEDAFFVAAGGEYDVTSALTVRSGVAFDGTPTRDTTALTPDGVGRTVRVPDGDRLWLSAGLSFDMPLFGYDVTADAAYSYLYALDDPTVTLREGPFAGSTVEYDAGAHIFSVGTSVRF